MKTIIIDGVEYNLTPKVAFHEGDWVIDKQGIVHQIANVIENVTYHTYGYDIVGGGYFNDNTEGVRHWTIQDAKYGDVLYCKSNYGVEYFVMSKGVNKHGNIDSYFRYNSLYGFGIDIPSVLSIRQDDITPATKEQRELLFQKMREAGYEWDAEKKELKKIEEKSVEWSEEDKENLYHINALIKGSSLEVYRQEYLSNWLESLRPQNTWKPSDEQIRPLEYAIEYFKKKRNDTTYLESLYQDLMKLREE